MRFDTNRAKMELFDNNPVKMIHALSVVITDFLVQKKYFATLQKSLTVTNFYSPHFYLRRVS